MVNPIQPYFVSFRYAELPSKPDHSSSLPDASNGPGRAGFTRVTVQKHLDIVWDDHGTKPDGSVSFFCRSVKVTFALDPITIAVSSDYPVDSCPYKVTWTHELEDHAKSFIRIFLSYRDILIAQLNGVAFPTERTPRFIPPKNIPGLQAAMGEQVKTIISTVAARLAADLEADRKAKDSPASYDAIYRKCSAADWQMHGN